MAMDTEKAANLSRTVETDSQTDRQTNRSDYGVYNLLVSWRWSE